MSGKILDLSKSASLIDPTSCDLSGLNQLLLNLILYEEILRGKCDEWNEVNTSYLISSDSRLFFFLYNFS